MPGKTKVGELSAIIRLSNGDKPKLINKFICFDNSSTGYSQCPEGYFCPAATGANWTACPTGRFSNTQGLDEETDCQSCSGGMYCVVTKLTSPVENCDAGYFCTLGVDTSQPDGTTNQGVGGICPPGYKCLSGSVNPTDCTAGTYQVY